MKLFFLCVREKDRDVSEKIALGLAKPSASSELMYDQRLFNKSQGVSSSLGDDESYGLYDKPLFSGSSAHSIYRPKKEQESRATHRAPQKRRERIARRDRAVEIEEGQRGSRLGHAVPPVHRNQCG